MATQKVRFGNRNLRVKDMTRAQVAENDGHMRNYLVYERFMGAMLVHVGFGDVNHNEAINRLFAQHWGASGQLVKIQQLV